MKRLILMLSGILLTATVMAQDCDMHFCVVAPDDTMCGGDIELADMLANRLTSALTTSGMTADSDYGQLYITGSFNDIYKEILPGPPAMTAVHTNLVLMVADIFGNKKFDSETIELRGVGTTAQRAYINALQQINVRNKSIEKFVARAKDKTIAYFDKNYPQLLNEAKIAAAQSDYEKALYLCGLVPSCSRGYQESSKALLGYYQNYIDRVGTKLLAQAKAAFAVSPNAEGAMEAYAILDSIDPSSSAYPSAMKFAEDVKSQVKAEYDFEVHEKYKDKQEKQLKLIDAARAVGVAYGKGQAPNTTNLLWK